MLKITKSPSLLLLILLIVFLLSVPIQVSAAWSSETRLTTAPGIDSLPSIAQINNGNIWVAWERKMPTSLVLYYKIYNGATWTADKLFPGSSGDDIAPYIMQTRNGTIFVFWAMNTTRAHTHYFDIAYRRSNNYGLSWTGIFDVTNSCLVPSDRYDNLTPYAMETTNGDIWVVWERTLSPGNDQIFYKVNHANSWASETQLTSSANSHKNPTIVQTKNSSVIIFSYAVTGETNYEVVYQIHNGSSWGPEKYLTQTPTLLDSDPAALLTRTGAIWVIWESQDSLNPADGGNLFYTSSEDNGNTWASASQLTFSVDGSYNGQAALTQGSDKRIWVAWMSNRGDNFDIYYKISDQLLYHDVAISGISLSKASPYQGVDVQATVNATNKGDFSETLTVKCYVNQTLVGTQSTSLQGGSSALIVFPWVTSTFAPGKYYIKATVNQVPNENTINLGDNTRTMGPVLLRIPGDVNADGRVNLEDLARFNSALGATPGHPNWDQECDIYENDIIDVKDLYILSSNYGQTV